MARVTLRIVAALGFMLSPVAALDVDKTEIDLGDIGVMQSSASFDFTVGSDDACVVKSGCGCITVQATTSNQAGHSGILYHGTMHFGMAKGLLQHQRDSA